MPSRKNNSYGATAASVMPFNSNLEAPPNFEEDTTPVSKINVVVNNLEGNSSNANTVMTAANNGASAPRINNSRNNTLVGGRRRKKRSRKSKKTRKNRR
jgi:hypothetical protein